MIGWLLDPAGWQAPEGLAGDWGGFIAELMSSLSAMGIDLALVSVPFFSHRGVLVGFPKQTSRG